MRIREVIGRFREMVRTEESRIETLKMKELTVMLRSSNADLTKIDEVVWNILAYKNPSILALIRSYKGLNNNQIYSLEGLVQMQAKTWHHLCTQDNYMLSGYYYDDGSIAKEYVALQHLIRENSLDISEHHKMLRIRLQSFLEGDDHCMRDYEP